MDKPWHVGEVDPAVVGAGHRARALPRGVEMGVDIISDPHAEDDDGYTGPCSAVLGTYTTWLRLDRGDGERDR